MAKAHRKNWRRLFGLFRRNKGMKNEYFHGRNVGDEPIIIKPGQAIRLYANYRIDSKPDNEPTHFLNIEDDS